jgi:hypothetical protein
VNGSGAGAALYRSTAAMKARFPVIVCWLRGVNRAVNRGVNF